MVAYNPLNQSDHSKSNFKVIGGALIMVLGIITFFCAVFVPIMFDNIFLMFPFFFGGFIIIIIGVVTLMIGIRNRSIASGIAPNSRIMGRYMNFANKIFSQKNRVNNAQNPVNKYGQAYKTSHSGYKSGSRKEPGSKPNTVTICSYCGTSNSIESEFCIGCNSKLEK
ncbi:hypothetical protein DSAG12_03772 [Promethearchaeum syntrophicum]|uniref:Zinc-ribbon domain-containing protein n=1 Tax=Promethearchaeum syntrophicum TaxID=2594042 RepID=A0A5B9DFM9_9ARCH|nr:hypothetical protein [Candidatus Prometheoarchaeum syntrophicum]QEE17934.1 hypothetical protein DSAG12_03772 [Candidatus Prometheoarchaeum syntrophicum]